MAKRRKKLAGKLKRGLVDFHGELDFLLQDAGWADSAAAVGRGDGAGGVEWEALADAEKAGEVGP